MAVNGKKTALLIFATLIAFAAGCGKSDWKDSSAIRIKLDVDSLLNGTSVSIDDIFQEIQLVCLDSSDMISNSVYSGHNYYTFDGEYFYVLDEKSFTIHVFDSHGKFVHSSSKKGRGPGEFTMATKICYNADLNTIDVLNPIGKIYHFRTKTLEYVSTLDIKGKDLQSIHDFVPTRSGYLLYSNTLDERIWHYDSENRIANPCGIRLPEYLSIYFYAQDRFYSMGESVQTFRAFDGKCFNLDSSLNVRTSLVWDFGKRSAQLKAIPELPSAREYHEFLMDYSDNHVAAFNDIKCIDRTLIANVIYKRNLHTIVYNLASNQAKMFLKTEEGLPLVCGLVYDNSMMLLVDSHMLPEFISTEVLDEVSVREYQKATSTGSMAIIRYGRSGVKP